MKRKKLLSLATALALCLGLGTFAAAAEGTDAYAEAQEYVVYRGIMQGTDKGFEPELEVTRAQAAQLSVIPIIIGATIGAILGVFIYHKMQCEIDEMIRQINDINRN